MRWVDLNVVMSEKGDTISLPVNADQVCFLMPKMIPTGLLGGSSGDIPITKAGTGIDFGGVRPIAVVGTVEEVKKLLLEAK